MCTRTMLVSLHVWRRRIIVNVLRGFDTLRVNYAFEVDNFLLSKIMPEPHPLHCECIMSYDVGYWR